MPKRSQSRPEGDGERLPLMIRTTRDLRAKLETEAATSGRSLTQEVELILEKHFWLKDHEPTRHLIDAGIELEAVTMSPKKFSDWMTYMREAYQWQPRHFTTYLGCSQKKISTWRKNGAPNYIALACIPLAHGAQYHTATLDDL